MALETKTPHHHEDRDVGLTTLALNGGNAHAAHRELLANGVQIPVRTLNDWKTRHAGRFAEIQNERAPEIAERVASRSEAVALKALEAEDQLIDKTIEGISDMKGTDAAAAFRNIATGKALQFDKLSNPIRGRATVRVDERDLNTILRSLERRYGLNPPGDITDATVIDDEPLLPDVADVNARELAAGESSS